MEDKRQEFSDQDKEELIERIVSKAELEFKCSGSHFGCAGEAGIEAE